MILSLLFLMLYCSMINVRCVFIIFRSACLLSSCYLRFAVSNVHAIFFQKIYIEESLMRCWRFDCWSFVKHWRCVNVLLTKKLLFLIFVMMIVCLMIFVQYNYRFSNTWFLCLKMTKIFFFEMNDSIATIWTICTQLLLVFSSAQWCFFDANAMLFFRVSSECKIDLKNHMSFNLFFFSIFILHWNDQTKWFS
jgi:hypothetical protein